MDKKPRDMASRLRRGWVGTDAGFDQWEIAFQGGGFTNASLCREWDDRKGGMAGLTTRTVGRFRARVPLEENSIRNCFRALNIAAKPGTHYVRAEAVVFPESIPRPFGLYVARTDLEEELIARIHFKLEDRRAEHGLLLSLEGDGGLGKTRLALQVLSQFAESTHEARFIRFEQVESTDRQAAFLDTWISALTSGPAPRTEEQLVTLIGRKPALFVLDNLETVAGDEVNSLLANILERCPRLAILATSRLPIGADDANVFDLGRGMKPDEAARLLRARFAEMLPADSVTRKLSGEEVREIVEACDYLPLAIENIAAMARTAVAPGRVAQEMRRIKKGETLRVSNRLMNPHLAGRNRAISASLAWGYWHIAGWAGNRAEAIQRAYRFTGIFAGPFTDADYDAVAGEGQSRWLPELHAIHVLDADPARGTWSQHVFRREFAHELLVEEGELDAALDRFFRRFTELFVREADRLEGENARPEILRLCEPNWMRALHLLTDRIVAGDRTAVGEYRALAGSIIRTQYFLGWDSLPLLTEIEDACGRLGEVLAQANAAHAIGAIYMCSHQEFDTALRWFSKAATLSGIAGSGGVANSLRCIGECHIATGNFGEARRHFEEALAKTPAADTNARAFVLRPLGNLLLQSGSPDGRKMIDEAREAFFMAGDLVNSASCDLILAQSEADLGHYSEAVQLWASARKMSKRSGLIRQQFHELQRCLEWVISWPKAERERYFSERQIRSILEDAVSLSREYGNPVYLTHALELEVDVLLLLGDRAAAISSLCNLQSRYERFDDWSGVEACSARLRDLGEPAL